MSLKNHWATAVFTAASFFSGAVAASTAGTFNLPQPLPGESAVWVKGANQVMVSRDVDSVGDVSVEYTILGMDVTVREGVLEWSSGDDSDKAIVLDGVGHGHIVLSNPSRTDGQSELPVLGNASVDITYLPVLVTGDSWSGGTPGNQYAGTSAFPVRADGYEVKFYEDFLIENSDLGINSHLDIVSNTARMGRGMFFNSYGTMHSIEQEIAIELASAPRAKFVVITAGGNDLGRMPVSEIDLQDLQDSVRRISDVIVQSGATPIWSNVGLVNFIWNRLGWQNSHSDIVHSYNGWLETFCATNGYGFINFHDEFVIEANVNPPNPDISPTYFRPELHPDYWITHGWGDIPARTHLNHAGAQHMADLVLQEIDDLVDATKAHADLTLPARSYVREEGGTLDLTVFNTGDTTGAEDVLVYNPDALTSPYWFTMDKPTSEGDSTTEQLTIGTVGADTETDITVGIYGSAPFGISETTLKIVDMDGPGEISLLVDSFTVDEEQVLALTFVRSDGADGNVQAQYSITPASLVASGQDSGSVDWDDGQYGPETKYIDIERVTANELAAIEISSTSGNPLAPGIGAVDTADLHIVNAQVPGRIEIVDNVAPDDDGKIIVNENSTFDLEVKRTGVIDGSASVLYSIQGSTATPNWGQLNWAEGYWPDYGERVASVTITVGEVSTDTDYQISIGGAQGSVGQPSVGTSGTESITLTVLDVD